MRWYYQTLDENTINGTISQSEMYKSYLENVVVDPQLSIEDFDKQKGSVKNVEVLGYKFSIKNPGVAGFLDIVSNSTNPDGTTNQVREKELYMEIITYKNKPLSWEVLDEMENGFSALNVAVLECRKYSLEDKRGELNAIMAECENFLTGRD